VQRKILKSRLLRREQRADFAFYVALMRRRVQAQYENLREPVSVVIKRTMDEIYRRDQREFWGRCAVHRSCPSSSSTFARPFYGTRATIRNPTASARIVHAFILAARQGRRNRAQDGRRDRARDGRTRREPFTCVDRANPQRLWSALVSGANRLRVHAVRAPVSERVSRVTENGDSRPPPRRAYRLTLMSPLRVTPSEVST